MIFVFLFISTSIKSSQNQDIHLYAVYKNISSYLQVCTQSLVSVFQQGSGCFAHLQNTTPIYDEISSHSLGFSEPVNTTTILIKERNSTGIYILKYFKSDLSMLHIWNSYLPLRCFRSCSAHTSQKLLLERFCHVKTICVYIFFMFYNEKVEPACKQQIKYPIYPLFP